jgi:hypothetical protein
LRSRTSSPEDWHCAKNTNTKEDRHFAKKNTNTKEDRHFAKKNTNTKEDRHRAKQNTNTKGTNTVRSRTPTRRRQWALRGRHRDR